MKPKKILKRFTPFRKRHLPFVGRNYEKLEDDPHAHAMEGDTDGESSTSGSQTHNNDIHDVIIDGAKLPVCLEQNGSVDGSPLSNKSSPEPSPTMALREPGIDADVAPEVEEPLIASPPRMINTAKFSAEFDTSPVETLFPLREDKEDVAAPQLDSRNQPQEEIVFAPWDVTAEEIGEAPMEELFAWWDGDQKEAQAPAAAAEKKQRIRPLPPPRTRRAAVPADDVSKDPTNEDIPEAPMETVFSMWEDKERSEPQDIVPEKNQEVVGIPPRTIVAKEHADLPKDNTVETEEVEVNKPDVVSRESESVPSTDTAVPTNTISPVMPVDSPEDSQPEQKKEKHIKISTLLLNPKNKKFELIQVRSRLSSASVRDVLDLSALQATEPSLASQNYSGLYHYSHEEEITDDTLKEVRERHVLVAVPEGYTAKEVAAFAKNILSTRSMSDLVHRLRPRHSSKKKRSSGTSLSTVHEHEKKVKMLVVLLDPRFRMFEVCEIKYRPSTSSVQYILNKIPDKASRPELGYRTYTGLCRPSDGSELTDDCLVDGDCHLAVAVPKRCTRDKIASYARQILSSRKVEKLLGDKLDKDALHTITEGAPTVELPTTKTLFHDCLKEASRSAGALSDESETESLPSVMSVSMTSSSSLDMSSSCLSTNDTVVVCSPPPPPPLSPETPVHRRLVKNLSTVYVTSLDKKRRRARRAQRVSFTVRVSVVVMATMVFVYRNNAIGDGTNHGEVPIGMTGLVHTAILMVCMIVVQGHVQEQAQKKKDNSSSRLSGIPETVLVEVEENQASSPSFFPMQYWNRSHQ